METASLEHVTQTTACAPVLRRQDSQWQINGESSAAAEILKTISPHWHRPVAKVLAPTVDEAISAMNMYGQVGG